MEKKADEAKAEQAKTGPAKPEVKAAAAKPEAGKKPETSKPGSGKPDAGGAKPADPAQLEMAGKVKEIENAMFAVKFYPVAVKEEAKDEALGKLRKIYKDNNETVRQMLLYSIHECLATSAELKLIHTAEYFKIKNQGNDNAQHRMNVYRAMFNYTTSLEGLIELIDLLGSLNSDDSAKLLTYHFSHLASAENEAHHMLRGAILEALGKSESVYALRALLEYARCTDSERTFNRIASALSEWEDKLDEAKMPDKDKAKIREKLKEILTSELRGSHYG